MVIVSKPWCALVVMLLLCSCGQREGLAPVVEVNWQELNSHAKNHVVQRGETLYAIAFRYDKDYRQLALANRLSRPYTLRVGQQIYLHPSRYPVKKMPAPPSQYPIHYYTNTNPVQHTSPQTPSVLPSKYTRWLWPIQGRVVANYVPQQGKKGIDIAGKKGDKIHASSAGVVAYAGSGLTGYGNLIIIKHDNQFLTAYGNNLRNLVQEGQHISAGQTIAEIGVVDRRYWGVHFEIRKMGKPVNPLSYLQKKG